MNIFYFSIMIGSMFLLGCFSKDVSPRNDNDILQVDYELFIADTLNPPAGEYIGNVVDLCGHPDYGVLVLDNARLRVVIYREDMPAFSFGRQGRGPGEFEYPLSITSFDDGRILVADELQREIMIYSSRGDYQGSFFDTDWHVPYEMVSLDSTIVCDLIEMEYSSNVPEYTYSIRRYSRSEPTPLSVYRELRWEWTSADFYTDIGSFDFTASRQNLVYICEDVSNYMIDVLALNGDYLYSIRRTEVERQEKSENELEAEKEEFETWAQQDQAYMGGYEPSEFHALINLSGVDAEGRLWVRRLDQHSSDIVFDLFDSEGQMCGSAVLRRDSTACDLVFKVDSYGIYATTSSESDFVEVYLLDVSEAT